jgi:cytochrome c biogenesis protein
MVNEVVVPYSSVAPGFPGLNKKIRVDDFRIDFRPDGSVKQFYSDIALDTTGAKPAQATTIAVNAPLRKDSLTVYQTSWKVGAMRVRVRPLEGTVPDMPSDWREYELPMSPLDNDKFSKDANGGFLPLTRPVNDIASPGRTSSIYGILFVGRDLEQVTIFGPDGAFAGVRRADSNKPIVVAGYELVVTGLRGAAGLELKSDPGVPWVYAGFAGTMLTTAVSLIPYNQVWFRQANKELYVGGKSNRAKDQLDEELKGVVKDAMRSAPELG